MKAVVLVGGEGTRLRPLTYTTPKQLLPVVEVSMVERVLGHLALHGIGEAVLSLGYRPDAFIEAFPDGVAAGVRLDYAVEPEPLDTAGAVLFAALHAHIDDTFVVVNGDVLTDVDISMLVEYHRKRRAEATIHLTPVEDPSRFGVVSTDEEGRVLEFIEKPAAGEATTNLINAGTYVLEPSVLELVPSGRKVSIERETFPALAREGSLYALASEAYWLDTGTPDAYLQANTDLLSGRRGVVPAPLARPVRDGVWVIDAPEIHGELGPGSLVGDGAVVGEDALVEASVVGAGCVVEPSAIVEGSVLLPGARIGARSRVRGSIIGHGSRLGAGCRLEPVTVVGDMQVVEAGTVIKAGRVPAHGAR